MLSIALPFTATRLQASTYLLGVCLFSISFLVFLNSAVSFVITDRIGQKEKVGDAVGTLGFADELVALVACPVWGILSDRVGVRTVAVCGYLIVGVSLILFVQASNVYPQLLLGRLLFSVGGAATSTMVTAILPAMTYRRFAPMRNPPSPRTVNGSSHTQAPSISSELTITPARFRSRTPSAQGSQPLTTSEPSASQLAGIVGMLTGFGALVALLFFLRLPTRFQDHGISPSQAVADSFYVVGSVALAVAVGCFFGLRGLSGEEDKGWKRLLNRKQNIKPTEEGFLLDSPPPLPSYPRLLAASITLGIRDMNIGLGYVGGFVARASSVGISLFIPLFVNAYFIQSGRCPANPGNSPKSPGEIKENCARAYIVASIISGVSQLVALICAPIFGYLSSVYQTYNFPLLLASVAGVAGYATFGNVKSPDPQAEDGSYGIFFIAALLGISQIGAIVCSLGLLARGIEAEDDSTLFLSDGNGLVPAERNGHLDGGVSEGNETSHLLPSDPSLPSHLRDITGGASRSALKGSIAGVYSLAGGAGILLLTKVGGLMFDKVEPGSPFFLMAGFNAVLFAITLSCDVWTGLQHEKEESSLGRYEDLEGDLREAV